MSLDLEVLRWAHGGDGVAVPREGPLAGRVVFVPGAVPGDHVTAEVVKAKARWARVRVLSVERPSAERVAPACAHQARCGGCPWMIGGLGVQARARLAILRGEAKKRLGWSADEAAARVSLAELSGAQPLGYRARIRLAWRRTRGGLSLGYRARGSHELVDIAACAVADPRLNASLGELRAAIERSGARRGEVRLVVGDEGVAAWLQPEHAAGFSLGPQRVTLHFGPRTLSASPRAFVQANPGVAAALIDAIEGAARALGGGHAVELFAGSGLLSEALWSAGFSVDAYEVDPAARAPFLAAAAAARAPDSRWHLSDLLTTGLVTPPPRARPDLVLLDPPRGGAAPVMPWVRAVGARLVVMVSCDVATAFRDLALLTETGAYRVTSIRGYDMFPHTGHQELLALVERI